MFPLLSPFHQGAKKLLHPQKSVAIRTEQLSVWGEGGKQNENSMHDVPSACLFPSCLQKANPTQLSDKEPGASNIWPPQRDTIELGNGSGGSSLA